MLRIDDSYDVILTYSPIIEITGHLFECFDYYLYLRQYCKVGILLFNSLSTDKLKIVFESKYSIPFSDVESDIIDVNQRLGDKSFLVSFGRHTKVLLTDGNIDSLQTNRIHLLTNNLYGFLCENNDDYKNIKINNKITFLQDYRIYGKNKDFPSINYVKKIPFDFYKNINRVYDNTGMMYITYVCRKITRNVLIDYHNRSKCDKTIIAVPYKIREYEDIPDITQEIAPIENFFERFDTYIYTPVQRKFDCSPRLVTECFLYGKNIMLDLDYEDIGLMTRYNDCKQNIKNVILSKGDDVISILDIKF